MNVGTQEKENRGRNVKRRREKREKIGRPEEGKQGPWPLYTGHIPVSGLYTKRQCVCVCVYEAYTFTVTCT